MSAGFYDYVRGRSDAVPPGYSEPGLRAYRHLVFLGVSQLLAAHFQPLRERLSDEEWRFLLANFIRTSAWESNFYGDLADEFVTYLASVQSQRNTAEAEPDT